MRFEDLEHMFRASAALLDDEGLLDSDTPEFVIVGSAEDLEQIIVAGQLEAEQHRKA